MLQSAFIFIAVFGCLYFFLRKRRFDYISLGFFSSIVYFMPLFFGYTRGTTPNSIMAVAPTVYGIGIALLTILVITGELGTYSVPQGDKTGVHLKPIRAGERLSLLFLAVLSYLSLAATIWTAGADLASPDKSQMMDDLSRFHVLMVFSGLMGVIWSFLRGFYGYIILFSLVIVFDIYLGFRMGAGIAFVAIVTTALFYQGKRSLTETAFKNRKLSIIAICGIAFLFVYKRLYILIKSGYWDLVLSRIFDSGTYKTAILKSEPFGTQSILNKIVKEEFSTDGSYLLRNIYQVVPFSNEIGSDYDSFNAIFQPALFPKMPGGMAGNWWAEWFAAFSWIGLALGIFIYVGGLYIFSYLHGRFAKSTSLSVLISISGTFFAFYIHRNEINYFITLEKRVLWLWLLIVGAGALLKVAAGRRGQALARRTV